MARHFDNPGHDLLDSEFSFCSGANSPAEIRALIMSGNNPGVAVNHLSESGMAEIEEWAGAYWNRFFVDSGAFSEVTFVSSGPEISKPISREEWENRLRKYDRLAGSMGKQVYLVAPDCVAHQDETLRRLATYGPRIISWMLLGANVIVPVQKGSLSMAEFARQVVAFLGTDSVIWGIPMKKDATSIAELRCFVSEMRPRRVHLLGMGLRSKSYRAAKAAVLAECRDCEVYSDSVRITALVGRSNGRDGGPRPITRYLAEGLSKGHALQRAMSDELREDIATAQADGWFDDELDVAPRGQLRMAI